MLRPVAEFRYAQFCPLARAAEVVGNRWSLLVLRELMVGPQRFSDLKRRLAGVSTSVLSERLAALEAFEVITQAELPPPGAVRVYQLTPHGAAFRPILLDLARWGLHWLSAPSTGDHFETGWLRLGLEAFAAPAPTPARRFALRVAGGDETAQIRFEGGAQGLRFLAGDAPVDLSFEAGPAELMGLLTGLLPADAARARGAQIAGDEAALAELPRLFRFDVSSRAQPGDHP
jgi:DNA-binding HxlR family transcriptional regulator